MFGLDKLTIFGQSASMFLFQIAVLSFPVVVFSQQGYYWAVAPDSGERLECFEGWYIHGACESGARESCQVDEYPGKV